MRINIDDTDIDDSLSYTYNGELFTGELVETNPSGVVVALTPVVNGRINGVDRTWHTDGSLESEATVVDGVALGISRGWHRNGQLSEERVFNDRGRLVEFRRWDADGTLLPPDPHPSQRSAPQT